MEVKPFDRNGETIRIIDVDMSKFNEEGCFALCWTPTRCESSTTHNPMQTNSMAPLSHFSFTFSDFVLDVCFWSDATPVSRRCTYGGLEGIRRDLHSLMMISTEICTATSFKTLSLGPRLGQMQRLNQKKWKT